VTKTGVHKSVTLHVQLRDDVIIAVPASLSAITTYVLLEQEEWFEKEVNFLRRFLRPGMVTIDIGANLGVYSLLMARLVGPGGQVFSYEPGAEARTFLESSRTLGGLKNLEIVGVALSDSAKEGDLAFAGSTELRTLGPPGSGERIRITSLDLESAERSWSAVDFVKIDAEGEEERIIAGGRSFFASHSPLVMFEIKAGDKVNDRLRTIFPEIGYRLFRQLVGEAILIPDDATQPLDGYELNLFAAKPDRANALARHGLLVESVPEWTSERSENAEYENALSAYATWRATDQPLPARCAALAFALRKIRAACARAGTAEQMSSYARIAWEWGARGESVGALRQLLQILRQGRPVLKKPFLPVSSRFDSILLNDPSADWFPIAAAEQHERICSFSSIFAAPSPFLPWLCGQRLAGAEMPRRHTLIAARAGLHPRVPERLCVSAPDHLNADIWRAGMIPGTVLR
jgi:FkbM family methyltransferase